MMTMMPSVILALLVILGLVIQTVQSTAIAELPMDLKTTDLKMKGAHPVKNDQYFCTSYSVPDEDSYIVKFEALADASTAHHILVFGCMQPHSTDNYWTCGQTCGEGREQILFAWAKNAPPLVLPKHVGRHIGPGAYIKYIVVQIHYAHALDAPDFNSGIKIYTTEQRQKYVAGIYLLMAYDAVIPANTSKVHVDISCQFNWMSKIHPFGYRTHAHVLGTVISGYRQRDGEYTLIGKGNPQWPQAFYPVGSEIDIQAGDVVGARCTYSSLGRNRNTKMGATAADEMCNFYIMYYMNEEMEDSRGEENCANYNTRFNFPAGSDVKLPPNPALEEQAHHHHHQGMPGAEEKPTTAGVIIPGVVHKPEPNILVDEAKGNDAMEIDSVLSADLAMTFISAVPPPKPGMAYGQIGGLATNSNGDLHIFHRGSRVWNSLSFDNYNTYQLTDLPVSSDAVVILNKDGQLIRKFGKGSYFLPHGLSLDKDDNIWLTDVALHQVFKIPKGESKPSLILGERFVPGADDERFCKPTDVAVMSTGEFFVADGYCNARIMKFDKSGKFIKQWGSASDEKAAPGTFNLPHALALAEDKGLLCVADRENGRIQCFDLNGNFIRQMKPKDFGRTLYALEYCPQHGGILFAVNGPGFSNDEVQGFTLDINTGRLLSKWNIPQTPGLADGLTHPHDVTVDSDRHLVYVGELNPAMVWKFQMSKSLYETSNGYMTSLIIGILLIVPVILVVLITILVRLYHQGRLGSWRRNRGKAKMFNLGNLLNSHKGFDRLSTEDDDHDLENAMDDSDNEEFNITKNMKA